MTQTRALRMPKSMLGFVLLIAVSTVYLIMDSFWCHWSSSNFLCFTLAFTPNIDTRLARKEGRQNINNCLVDNLTDVPGYKMASKLNNTVNTSLGCNAKIHDIVVFNPATFFKMEKQKTIFADCTYPNCKLTKRTHDLRNPSAIMFFLTSRPVLPDKPPLLPSERRPDQIWVFYYKESPVHHYMHHPVYKNVFWRNTLNWTMTYTLDSDIFHPNGIIEKRTVPIAKDYKQIFRNKTKTAAWVVSHCHTQSKREIYVNNLRKYGVDVDIFGACAGKRVDTDTIRKKISLNYKFYLAFENSFCKDYITEKFFGYFSLDVVLVTRGGGDYDQLLPNNSFINTSTFPSAKYLANYLLSVASSEERYTDYLRNKDKFQNGKVNKLNEGFCQLCEKLNNLDKYRKVYKDVVSYIHKDTCFKPRDLSP